MLRIASSSLLDFAGLTSPGQMREHNEDSLLCCPALGLWAVADGMGGHQCGEVASALALQALEQAVGRGERLEAAVHSANRAVLEAAQDGMGTTIVAVRFEGIDFELAWVGDSRAYRVTAAETLEDMVEQLIGQANAHGGRDNISCIVLGHSLPPPSAEPPRNGLFHKLLKPFKS